MGRYSVPYPGGHEFSDMRAIPDFRVLKYNADDVDETSLTVSLPVEPGTIVTRVIHMVDAPFLLDDGEGGEPSSVTIDVGDGEDADCFIENANIDPSTLGNTAASHLVKRYASTNCITLTFSEKPLTGSGRLLVETLDLSGTWRKPAL